MILITGGNGYLGGRLAMFFSTFGKKKVVITRRDRSAEPNKILSECDRRIMDITNIDQVNNCLEDITDVIHLVSPNAKACMEDPELAKEINIDGTRNLVRACKDRKVNRFI